MAETLQATDSQAIGSLINPGVLELYAVKHEVIDQGMGIRFLRRCK